MVHFNVGSYIKFYVKSAKSHIGDIEKSPKLKHGPFKQNHCDREAFRAPAGKLLATALINDIRISLLSTHNVPKLNSGPNPFIAAQIFYIFEFVFLFRKNLLEEEI